METVIRAHWWHGLFRHHAPAAQALPHGIAAGALVPQARMPAAQLLAALGTSTDGLTETEAAARRLQFGPNLIAREQPQSGLRAFIGLARNPLNALLLTLAAISWLTGEGRAAILILVMIVLSVALAFMQEHKSSRAAAALRAMVKTVGSVRRRDAANVVTQREVPIDALVPGDVVHLSAGDLVPADLRVMIAKDLHVNQSSLTGEAMPVEKHEGSGADGITDAFQQPNLCFMGSNVVSGTATCVVLRTGAATFFGGLADDVAGTRAETDFDRGVTRFTWLMIRFIAVMVPAVFLINGFTKGDWLEAMLFALAVAVGLTPEMLPMIVTVNLAKGAIAMSRKQVIVKRLNAIQNFGAMDVLCTDKTGTLTQDRIILQYHLDFEGRESARVLEYAFLNSHYQSGLRNLLDEAVLRHAGRPEHAGIIDRYTKADEMPFDFQRRRMSVVLDPGDGTHLLICKGAVEEVFAACDHYALGDETGSLDPRHFDEARQEMEKLNNEGFRVVAVAFKVITEPRPAYNVADETGLTLLGYAAFLDPPKETAAPAIVALRSAGVSVKILTGDNPVITRTVCRQVGVASGTIVLGSDVEAMSDEQLGNIVESATVFARMTPAQKARIVEALHRRGHVVGFVGDGINDGPALKAADVGVSVDTAVDIAKESADIILLEKSLAVLTEGVMEGRRVFGNIIKYIRMGASSSFGNMFSVLGASLFLPFLPMTPIQVLTNNLLYDFSQTTIPTDTVDPEYLLEPRRWDIGGPTKFVLCMGPISSVFDCITFFALVYVFDGWNNPALFQAGWFVESLMTQTLIIHIIRTARIPLLESRASHALMVSTAIIVAIGCAIPYSFVGRALGFMPLPHLYWVFLIPTMLAYGVLGHIVKSWLMRRWGM